MKVIGVTGGTGVGKSVVSEYLADKGFALIDADEVGKMLVEPGMPMLTEYVKAFGEEILFEDGSLNRKLLGEIVFADSEKLDVLNGIAQKVIIEYISNKIEEYKKEGSNGSSRGGGTKGGSGSCCGGSDGSNAKGSVRGIVLDAALLFEWDCLYLCDLIWVVDADIEVRIDRIMTRDGISRKTALDRIGSQIKNDRKKEMADLVLDNSKDLDWVYQQVDEGIKTL